MTLDELECVHCKAHIPFSERFTHIEECRTVQKQGWVYDGEEGERITLSQRKKIIEEETNHIIKNMKIKNKERKV